MKMPVTLMTIEEAARLVVLPVGTIQDAIRDDLVPYGVASDGILLPQQGFISCLQFFYDLETDLDALHEAAARVDPSVARRLLADRREERRS